MPAERTLDKPEISLRRVRFDGFRFDLASDELWRDEMPVPLRPRAALALRLPLAKAGEIVSREELRSALWDEITVEWQDGLHQIIRELRKAIGDNAQSPVFIETVSRRGYRFRAPLEPDARAPLGKVPIIGRRDVLVFAGGVLAVPTLVVLASVVIGAGA